MTVTTIKEILEREQAARAELAAAGKEPFFLGDCVVREQDGSVRLARFGDDRARIWAWGYPEESTMANPGTLDVQTGAFTPEDRD